MCVKSIACAASLLVIFCLGPARAEEVAELQRILTERNCQPGPIDGAWGGQTERALQRFNSISDMALSRPISESEIASIRASAYACLAWEELALNVYDGETLVHNVAENGPLYCALQSGLVSQDDARVFDSQIIEGEDLALYVANSEPFLNNMLALNVHSLLTGEYGDLRQRFLNLVESGGFTHLEPYRPRLWNGQRTDWIDWYARNQSMSEPTYAAAILLASMAQSFGILRNQLTNEEREAAIRWGNAIYRATNIRGIGLDNGPDRRAAFAAAYTTWGAVTGSRQIFDRGVQLFRQGVDGIRSDGSEGFFVGSGSHQGYELQYQNMTYAMLAVAAWAIEKTGEPAFSYSRLGGGSLVDGINFHLEQSFSPIHRVRMQRNQSNTYWLRSARNRSDLSFAFMEFVADSGLTTSALPLLEDALALRTRGHPDGFFGGHHGGYTSCLLAHQIGSH